MCALSMVMNNALNWPEDRWNNPEWRGHFEQLVKDAKEYDEKTGQPDCENDEKKKLIQDIADKLGVPISFS